MQVVSSHMLRNWIRCAKFKFRPSLFRSVIAMEKAWMKLSKQNMREGFFFHWMTTYRGEETLWIENQLEVWCDLSGYFDPDKPTAYTAALHWNGNSIMNQLLDQLFRIMAHYIGIDNVSRQNLYVKFTIRHCFDYCCNIWRGSPTIY